MRDKKSQYCVFPLSGVVLYPGMLMPLHVFENRYKKLLHRVLKKDKRVTVALVRPGQPRDNEDHEMVFNVATEGEIIHCQKLDGDTYNIVIEGLNRINLGTERLEGSVRVFEGEEMEDTFNDSDLDKIVELGDVVFERVQRWITEKLPETVHETILKRILEAETIGNRLDRMSSFVIHSVANRQVILQTKDVLKRAEILENLTRWAGVNDYYKYVSLN